MAAAVAAVRRVHAPCAAELRELVALCEPFVATGLIDSWASRGWTPAVLEQSFGSTSICVRLYPRSSLNAGSAGVPTDAIGASNVPFEGECVYVQATMREFSQWLRHGGTSSTVPLPPSSPFLRFPRDVYWGYSDYQDMKALFAQTAPEALAAVDWSSIGLQHVAASALDGSHSTLWFGSAEASTPCHFDTYGCNFVAQCIGTKRWRLHPPNARASARSLSSISSSSDDDALRGTPSSPGPSELPSSRVPYEESSVFLMTSSAAATTTATIAASAVREEHHASHSSDAWCEVMLQEGELLHVPRHWWHDVLTVSPYALSINTWVDAPEDTAERVREAVARLLACALVRAARGASAESDACAEPHCGWINPTEELGTFEDDVEMLHVAAGRAANGSGRATNTSEAPAAADGAASASGAETLLCEDVAPEESDDASHPASSVSLGPPLTAIEIARAVCIGPPIEAAARALARRAAALLVDGGSGGSGGGGGVRLRAPLARVLRCALVGSTSASFALAIGGLRDAPGGTGATMSDIINSLCTAAALEHAVAALGRCYSSRGGFYAGQNKRGRDAFDGGSHAVSHANGTCDCDESCVVA